jgi:hypothetical protein
MVSIMKKRLYLAFLLTPSIFLPLLWLYPSSLMATANYSMLSGICAAFIVSFSAAYSVAMFAHALLIKDDKNEI